MVYITGDTHGNFNRVIPFAVRTGLKENGSLIVLGDAELNYYNNKKDKEVKKLLMIFHL